MANKKLHLLDALELLKDKQEHHIRVWKRTDASIIDYRCSFISQHRRGGTVRIKITSSGQIREFREVSLFAIDSMEVYL